MPNSGIIDLAIGLAFVFAVTAAVSSVVTELIARFLGLRGAYLLRGLRELVDGDGSVATDLAQATADYQETKAIMAGPPQSGEPATLSATSALLGSPILSNQGMTGQISSRTLVLPAATSPATGPAAVKAAGPRNPWDRWSQSRSLPSYISSRSFAEAVVNLLVPSATGQTTMTAIQQSLAKLPASMPTLASSLQALAANAGDDVAAFRTSVENWYDDHMDRVSGWYKRHVAKITLLVGAILILLLNINTLTIGRALYTESTLATAVSSVAAQSTPCPVSQDQQTCLLNLEGRLSNAAAAGLPVGWSTVPACSQAKARCNWLERRGILSRHGGSGWHLALIIIGFLLTITAIVPGARFWFGLLSKIGSIRATGPKPAGPVS
jgi:hypothetical protein